jgi:hypothetical protein
MSLDRKLLIRSDLAPIIACHTGHATPFNWPAPAIAAQKYCSIRKKRSPFYHWDTRMLLP